MKRKRFVKLMMATGLSRNCVTSNLGVIRMTGGYRLHYERWIQLLKFADYLARDGQAIV